MYYLQQQTRNKNLYNQLKIATQLLKFKVIQSEVCGN